MLKIHPTAIVSPLADIEDSVLGTQFILGENSTIDSFVKIKPAGGTGDIIIGSTCYINSGCVLYSGNGINIGNFVSIASNCTLAPVNHAFQDRNRTIQAQGFSPSKGGIIIEDDVWIGANCVILDGAKLRKGCVIAAGSTVIGEVEEFDVVGGFPLKKLGQRN